MLRIERVQIRNIRSVHELDVSFDSDGVTAVVGASGAGKSTIFAAAAWCLWGEIRGGLVQAEARRDGSDPTEPCEVIVDAVCGDTHIRAHRSLRQQRRKGRASEVASGQLWIDGVEQENITPTGLTGQVTSITGLTGRAFAGAFYMPQGQLEALAEGTPTEIANLFEEQTGLDRLTKRLAVASENARDLLRAAEAMPGTAEDAGVARAEADEATAEAQQHMDAAKQARAAADKASAEWREAQNLADRLADQVDAAQTARNAVTAAEARVQQATETAQQAADQAAQTGFATAEAAGQAERTASRGRDDARTVGARLSAALKEHGAAETARANIDTGSLPSMADCDTAIRDAEHVAELAEATLAGARDRLTLLTAESARLQKVIDTLAEASGDPCCPTCQQNLPDGANGLLTAMRDQQKETDADRSDADRDLQAAQQSLAGARRALADAQSRAGHTRTVLARIDDADRRVVQAADALRAATPDGFTDPKTALDELHDRYAKADAAARAAGQAAAAHQSAQRAAATVEVEQQRLATAIAARDALNPPSGDQVAAARASAAALRAAADTAAATAAAAESLAASARDGAGLLVQVADTQQQQWDAKRGMQRDAEKAAAAHDVLKAYRQEVLAEYTGAVADAATDLASRLGTEHVGFDLDGDFIPRVVLADGSTRPTRVLSGGEKARAALCFRLGIAAQITGGQTPGMVLADEITSAHDAETRGAIMSMLKQLGLPVVIISHSPEITDIASSVLRVTKGVDGTVLDTEAA